MAGPERKPAAPLIEEIAHQPGSYGFYPAARRIECALAPGDRLGYARTLKDEPVRFGQEPTLAFAEDEIASLVDAGEPFLPKLILNCLGLLGPNGALPLHFTDLILQRSDRGDYVLQHFLDIFHHRIATLLYRAWSSHQRTVSHDRPKQDHFGGYLACLAGIGLSHLKDRDTVPDLAKWFFVGRLAGQPRNAEGLAAIVGFFFDVPAHVEPFVGRWLRMPLNMRTRLGESPATGSLGESAMLGSHVWEAQQTFRLVMGPMKFATYQSLLPDRPGHQQLLDWMKLYCGQQRRWVARLELIDSEVPRCKLGQIGQLGWSAWLLTEPSPIDRRDLVLESGALD